MSLHSGLRLLRNRLSRWRYRTRDVDPTSYLVAGSTISRDLRMGAHGFIARGAEIPPRVEIGRFAMLARDVLIVGGDHRIDMVGVPMIFSDRPATGTTRIGDDVWIGARAIVMRGVTIGQGAVIGAGAVVTRDVEPYAIMGGVPARRIGSRFAGPAAQRHDLALRGPDCAGTFPGPLT